MSHPERVSTPGTAVIALSTIDDPTLTVTITPNDELRVQNSNEAFTRVFGYKQREIRGEKPHTKLTTDNTDLKHEDIINSLRNNNEYNTTTSLLTGATEHEFMLRAIPHANTDNTAYITYIDTEQYAEQRRELEHEIESLKDYTNELTHDLRNALSVAKSETAKLEYKTSENEHGDIVIPKEVHETIVNEVGDAHNRLEALIDDEIADPTCDDELSDDAITIEPHGITSIVDECWSLVQTRNSTITIEDEFTIECNRKRTERVFENLFRNAIEHNDSEVNVCVGKHNTMTTTTRGEINTDAFYVEDNGDGIPEDMIDSVFECGVTTTGTGQGLAIVSEIAAEHDWDVSVRNKATGGVRFMFKNVGITG